MRAAGPADAMTRGEDGRHEEVGAKYLAPYFAPPVIRPIALHVAAKRYLCATEPDYFFELSPGSVQTLELQGGTSMEKPRGLTFPTLTRIGRRCAS